MHPEIPTPPPNPPRVPLISMVLFILLVNVIWLDAQLMRKASPPPPSDFILTTPTPIAASPIANVCPQSCLTQIREATASFRLPAPVPSQPPAQSIPAGTTGVREFFVSFGGGSNMSDDWQDVTGLSAIIDTANYSQIKKATFEASVHIPAANERAFVRLFNATDKHPVWFSEVSLEGADTTLLVSQPITLDPGEKKYQVQMKTSLKYQAILDQSRIHIVTY